MTSLWVYIYVDVINACGFCFVVAGGGGGQSGGRRRGIGPFEKSHPSSITAL
jgi:hypothetical protein